MTNAHRLQPSHSFEVALNSRFLHLVVIGLITIFTSAACAPQATPPVVDHQATDIAMGVAVAWTKTALAPTATWTATATSTPPPPTVTPTKGPVQPPVVVGFANCWSYGPGYSYSLNSHIKSGKQVQMVGVGSVPGWFIIINPYFGTQCWIKAADLSLDPNMDLSQIPMMTPFPLSPTP